MRLCVCVVKPWMARHPVTPPAPPTLHSLHYCKASQVGVTDPSAGDEAVTHKSSWSMKDLSTCSGAYRVYVHTPCTEFIHIKKKKATRLKKSLTLLCLSRIFYEKIILCVVHMQPLLPTSCCLSTAGFSASLTSVRRMASSSSSSSPSFHAVSVFDFLLTSHCPLCQQQQQQQSARCTTSVLPCTHAGLFPNATRSQQLLISTAPEAFRRECQRLRLHYVCGRAVFFFCRCCESSRDSTLKVYGIL